MWEEHPSNEDATLINLARTDRTYVAQRRFDQARLGAPALPPGRLDQA